MEKNYKIRWEETGIYITLFNEVSERLIEYVNGLIVGHKKFEEIEFQIWNFIDVNHYNIDSNKGEEIGALDKAASIWNKKMKVAVITENESLIDYTRNYIQEISGTSWECRLFSNFKSAEEWALEK